MTVSDEVHTGTGGAAGACPHAVVEALRPRLLVRGHVHPFGDPVPDRLLGSTRVVYVVGRRMLEP